MAGKSEGNVLSIIIVAFVIILGLVFIVHPSSSTSSTSTTISGIFQNSQSISSQGTPLTFFSGGFQQVASIAQSVNATWLYDVHKIGNSAGLVVGNQYAFNLIGTVCNGSISCNFKINTYYQTQTPVPSSWFMPKVYVNGLLASNGYSGNSVVLSFVSGSQYTIVSCPYNASSSSSNGCTQPIIFGT